MGLLPLFIDMASRSCLVVGGGGVAGRKVSSLLAAGCRVTVVAPRIYRQIRTEVERNAVTWQERGYQPGDTRGYFLVVAATDDRDLNRQIAEEARENGALVNLVDDQGGCNVFFPAVVRRGEVVLGIGTGGKSPYLAGFLRRYLDKLLPDELETVMDELARVRECREWSGEEKIPRYRDILKKYDLK